MADEKRKEVMRRIDLILSVVDIKTLCEIERLIRGYINAKNLKGR